MPFPLPDPYIVRGDVADGPGTQRNFDALAGCVLNTGGRSASLRFGAGTLTFPGGSAFTTATVVPHGLGKLPVTVIATGAAGATLISVSTFTASTFSVFGHTDDGSLPGAGTTFAFYWIALA